MKVVRLEMPDNRGPWRSYYRDGKLDSILLKTFENHSTQHERGMPLPHNDGISFNEYFEICGYRSLEEMRKWVYLGELSVAIRRCGLRVILMKVKNVKVGRNQVVFQRKDIIKQKDISKHFIIKKSKK